MRTKLLIFLQNMTGGGAERVVLTMLRLLDHSRFEAVLVLSSRTGQLLEDIPPEVRVIDLGVATTSRSIPRLRSVIRSESPDIVFSTLLRTNIALYLALIALPAQKPTIIFRSPNSPRQYISRSHIRTFSRFLLERAYRRAHLVLAQTPEMKDEICRYHRLNPNKVLMVPNPMDFAKIDSLAAQNPPDWDPRDTNIVSAGRITEQKGFDVLIDCLAHLVRANSSYFLHIIGEDSLGEQAKLELRAQELGVRDRVKFWGFQRNPYVFFKNCDIFVLSSRWEGMPNAMLENIYLESTVVATDCTESVSRLLARENAGYVARSGDADDLAQKILLASGHRTKIDAKMFRKRNREFFEALQVRS
ncbi:N-acetylgalactosamine-N,N'-diacetylbacillosaminyl-diphospho-undecaprenol 4-alpha-N-acetylgalactosaminyltransferase (plasmid) [Sulfitobacter indolifex]|nr:N-acetylgalactosamine-N,N'-diacetylbacillosaminyl-diphospho-undecaprenol 4-alpha-N-acetylgalactosaminyltransferase [Sulfitobacter indolifex]